MVSKITIIVFHIFLILKLHPSKAQTWIRVGYYWHWAKGFPVGDINSSLFTHLICGYAELNSTSYQLSILPSEEKYISTFTETVKQRNPSVTTLLAIGRNTDPSNFSSMMSNISYRKWFIDSSIKTARLYGFQGLDLWCASPNMTSSDSLNMGILFEEWRTAVGFEARNSSQPQLILTTAVRYSPNFYLVRCPTHSMQRYLNWIHVRTFPFSTPENTNFTFGATALYNPTNDFSIDNGIRAWIQAGLPANKLVICMPYHGYAWTLVNVKENGIGAPSTGPAISDDGFLTYSDIKEYIETNGAKVMYNATYVVNYCTIWNSWIGFNDVEAIRTKVSYAKEKGLLGYYVWQVSYDYNWVLSRAAAGKDGGNNFSDKEHKNGQLVIILTTVIAVVLLLCCVIYYRRMVKLKVKESRRQGNNAAATAGDLNGNATNLVLYSLADIEAATGNFSIENKLGEGGYGPVYKAILQDGQEVAVKRLSKISTQGFEEFNNEVMVTAKLQHINLVRLLGFCIDREEHILVYEYMSNKSLDWYLFG